MLFYSHIPEVVFCYGHGSCTCHCQQLIKLIRHRTRNIRKIPRAQRKTNVPHISDHQAHVLDF